MPERRIVLIDELPQRNGWCSDYLERTLDCKKCFFMATVLDGQSRPVFDICLWSGEWRMIRQGKPRRKCRLLQKPRPISQVFRGGVPNSDFIQMRLPLDFD